MTKQDTQIAILEEGQRMNTQEHKRIEESLLRIENKLDKKTDNTEFLYWRNVLVGGIIISIFLGVVSRWFK